MVDVACAPVLPPIVPVIPDEVEVVVLGGGVMGMAAAWQLARRGHETLLLEPGEPGGPGDCGGATDVRIYRQAYAHAGHIDLAVEALRSWRELEQETGTRLITMTGGVDHGDPMVTEDLACSLSGECVPYEWLEPDEAAFHWPGRVFDGPVLYQRDRTGRIHAARAVTALGMAAIGHGAVLRYRVGVGKVEPKGRGRVELRTSEGLVRAHRVVVASDTRTTWAAALLGRLVPLPSLRFVREQAALYELRPEYPIGPAFVHHIGRRHGWPGQAYGVATQDGRLEVGFHDVRLDGTAGPVPEVDAELLHTLQEYVQAYLPGLDHTRPEPRSCVYADTPGSSFRVRADGPLIAGTGFSGHDFALAPSVGGMLADLATGRVRVPA